MRDDLLDANDTCLLRSERVIKTLKISPRAHKINRKARSLSKAVLSDAVGLLLGYS
jgi:hypothetical protein